MCIVVVGFTFLVTFHHFLTRDGLGVSVEFFSDFISVAAVEGVGRRLVLLYLSKQHAMEYNLIVEAAEEGGFIGYVPEIPGAHTQGETKEEVRQNIVEAIQLIQEVRKDG